MFHSWHLNNKINKIQERALRIAYKDYVSGFDILLERNKSVTIPHEEFANPNDRNI